MKNIFIAVNVLDVCDKIRIEKMRKDKLYLIKEIERIQEKANMLFDNALICKYEKKEGLAIASIYHSLNLIKNALNT